MVKEAIVLAGGFGTRLKDIMSTPKSLAYVRDKPFLDYISLFLRKHGIEKIILSCHYKVEEFQNYIKKAQYSEMYKICDENKPLGTGGAIKNCLQLVESKQFLVTNGDTFFNFNLKNFINKCVAKNYDFSVALAPPMPNKRYGRVFTNKKTNKIEKFIEKESGINSELISINSGFYFVNKSFFQKSSPPESAFSVEKDYLEKMIFKHAIYGIQMDGFFIDIGVPEDFELSQKATLLDKI